jgi:hypothetical protein
MLNNYTLALSGEQLTELDDTALATIAGGFGIPWGKIAGEVLEVLWDCVKGGIDDVIEAAGEGYGDAR